MSQQRFQVRQRRRQRTRGLLESLERQAETAAELELGGGFVERIERRGVTTDQSRAGPQRRFEP